MTVAEFERFAEHGERLLDQAYEAGAVTAEAREDASLRDLLSESGWEERDIVAVEVADELPRAIAGARIRALTAWARGAGRSGATARALLEHQTAGPAQEVGGQSAESEPGPVMSRQAERDRDRRRPRAPNDPEANKGRFLAAFAACGIVARAADAAGVHRSMHYCWLDQDPAYGAAFAATRRSVVRLLEDRAVELATDGEVIGIWHAGRLVGRERRVDTRVLIRLLEAYAPDRFGQRQHLVVDTGEATRESAERRQRLLAVMEDPVRCALIEMVADEVEEAVAAATPLVIEAGSRDANGEYETDDEG